jgi:predicted O-methyltransferase YrrM
MNYTSFKGSEIIKPEFHHYQEAKPQIIKAIQISRDEWDMLEFYKKVHINEFFELISSINFNPRYVLEWGSGLSTYLLSDFCLKWNSKLLLTIDHDSTYQSKILAKLKKIEAIEVCTKDLIGAIWPWDKDIYNYATYPMSKNVKFDLIFIDGRRRNECLLAASKVLNNSGIVIVHDAWRKRYELGYSLFSEIRQFDEYLILGSADLSEKSESISNLGIKTDDRKAK